MGINAILRGAIRNNEQEYGYPAERIGNLLTARRAFSHRQTEAISIIQDIITRHGKKTLALHVNFLGEMERELRSLQPSLRDHVVHALFTFSLGVYLNENLLKPSHRHVDPFQWKIAGLFHDIGYPAQTAQRLLKCLCTESDKLKGEQETNDQQVKFHIHATGLDHLTNGKNGLALIQRQIQDWRLQIDAAREYQKMTERGSICHGMISALCVLRVIDSIYQAMNPERTHGAVQGPGDVNWNQNYFDNDIVPACTAIFIHNLHRDCFLHVKLSMEHTPLAFLLRLSDCLQDWGRPLKEIPQGYPARNYRIRIEEGKLVFMIRDQKRREEIEKQIQDSLRTNNIVITEQ